jgi:hypothetical protein
MKIPSIVGTAYAAIAIATAMPAAAHGVGETVTLHFEQAITNIPGKSLVALVVDYAPGGESHSHIHAKSAFIFGYVLSGEIESQVNADPGRSIASAKASTRRRALAIPSVAMRARRIPQSCSQCSSSIRTTRN